MAEFLIKSIIFKKKIHLLVKNSVEFYLYLAIKTQTP